MLCRESVWRDSYLPVPRLQVGVACVTAPRGLKDTQTQVATKQTNSILSVSHALNLEMDADFLNFRDFCLLPKWQENDKKTSLLDLTTEMNFLRSSPIVVFRILKRKKKKKRHHTKVKTGQRTYFLRLKCNSGILISLSKCLMYAKNLLEAGYVIGRRQSIFCRCLGEWINEWKQDTKHGAFTALIAVIYAPCTATPEALCNSSWHCHAMQEGRGQPTQRHRRLPLPVVSGRMPCLMEQPAPGLFFTHRQRKQSRGVNQGACCLSAGRRDNSEELTWPQRL